MIDTTPIFKEFKTGKTFTRKEFERVAKRLHPTLATARKNDRQKQRANLALVSVQRRVNNALAEKGLYLKSRDYYNEFFVVSAKKAAKEVVRYTNSAENATKRAASLNENLRTQYRLDLGM